jgi:membrane-bound lytic murein transglycosylase MltF
MRAHRSSPFILVLLLAAMCASARAEPLSGPDPRFPDDIVSAGEPLPPLPFEAALPASVRALIERPFSGDFDGMVERRMIRAGVAFNRTHYFVDRGVQRGVTYAYLKEFERALNAARRTGNLRIHVVFVPLPRDQLLPALLDGRVDIVAAQLTVTPERQALVDFSRPMRRNVSEVVVTAPGVPAVGSAEDLSGREVFVRRSSSYHDSLRALNARLERDGRPPVVIVEAPEYLEDDNLLEMVNAGLVEATVVDDYLAEFWAQLFTDMAVHRNAALRTGGELAAAFRKNSPLLAAEANEFIRQHAVGTAFGNIINRRYLQNTTFVLPATAGTERAKFESVEALFQRYSGQYRLDELLMLALGFRESRLDQSVRSRAGAIGVMQLTPATGEWLGVGDIRRLEPNIESGIKYVRYLIDRHVGTDPDELNRELLAIASYNAGPNRIRQLRREAERRGLDPNVWFANVEQVVSERIGRETVAHVSHVFLYYLAYRLVAEKEALRAAAATGLGPR